jgi:hypothetical protein
LRSGKATARGKHATNQPGTGLSECDNIKTVHQCFVNVDINNIVITLGHRDKVIVVIEAGSWYAEDMTKSTRN